MHRSWPLQSILGAMEGGQFEMGVTFTQVVQKHNNDCFIIAFGDDTTVDQLVESCISICDS